MRSTTIVINSLILISLLTSGIFAQWTNSSGKAYLTDTTKSVSIGTKAFLNRLDVEGAMAVGSSYSGNSAAPANGMIVQGNTGFGTTTVGSKVQVNGNMAVGYSASTAAPTNGLLVSGQVGIGATPTSTYKLVVEGKVGVREIVVTRGTWADFVLREDYKLKPIEAVEKDIKDNKHLEGIPTEAEVKKNGVSVGEMQTKLLQKVEELTLYLIDQNKKIEQLTRANDELNKKLVQIQK
jgi:hypothetical protein